MNVTDVAPRPDARRLDAAPSPSIIEIHGGAGGVSRESLRELAQYREVLFAFVVRQVKVKYKQAFVGIGWAVVQPLLAAVVFGLFLGRLSNVGSEGVPYLLFALAGMAAWNYFSTAASSASDSLIAEQMLLRKVYFPREILPLSFVGSALMDLGPGLATVALAAALYGRPPHLSWLALPLPVALLVLAAAAFGLALSSVNVYYRDVRYALPFVIQVALFATPVVYSLSVVPSRWRTPYAVLNPVAAAVDGVRRILIHGRWPDFGVTLGALGWTLVLLAGGYAFFKRLERGFSDRV